MNDKKLSTLKISALTTLFSGLLLSGCTSTLDGLKQDIGRVTGGEQSPTPQSAQPTDNRACARNFSVSGSFFSGRQYSTHNDLSGISASRAFKNVAQYMATKSWTVVNTDADLGVMTATQGVIGSDTAKTVPLNISVKKLGSGKVRVQATFSTSFGVGTSADGQKAELCKIVEAAA